MNQPIVITDVLDNNLFVYLNETLHEYSKWRFSNRSYDGGTPSWGYNSDLDSQLLFFEAASIIKIKVQRHIKKNIHLCKIHCNGQTSGQTCQFHEDFELDDTWTFVLFTELYWSTQWGGEFVSQHPESKKYYFVPYIPNTGALIPSNWQHYGQSPNANTQKLRTTMAFSYMEENLFHEELKVDRSLYLRYT